METSPPPDLEQRVIDLCARACPGPDRGVGIGDDAAVLEPAPGRLVVSTDSMAEGRHWDDRLSPADVGWKLAAVNVSDLGAMGVRPAWCTLALTLPTPLDLGWVEAFADGLGAALRRWGLPLVGGDTTSGPGRVATLTVGGWAPRPVLRSTARPGDELWVTGTLGRAAEAFFSPAPSPQALAWLRRPDPPVAFGVALGEQGLVTAMMDLSDGLARDGARLARASGVGLSFAADRLPGRGPLSWRTSFGEDYELLFTAHPGTADRVLSLAMDLGIEVSPIGVVTPGGGARLEGAHGWPDPLDAHFPVSAGPAPDESGGGR